MDFSCSMCFVGGMVFGGFLEKTTMLVLVTISLIIANHPLPELLGGVTPQSVLKGVIVRIGRAFRRAAVDGVTARNNGSEQKLQGLHREAEVVTDSVMTSHNSTQSSLQGTPFRLTYLPVTPGGFPVTTFETMGSFGGFNNTTRQYGSQGLSS